MSMLAYFVFGAALGVIGIVMITLSLIQFHMNKQTIIKKDRKIRKLIRERRRLLALINDDDYEKRINK